MSPPVAELPAWMTPGQCLAYRGLETRWPRVSWPLRGADGAEMHVECFYPGALGSRWIAIQPDGLVRNLPRRTATDAAASQPHKIAVLGPRVAAELRTRADAWWTARGAWPLTGS